MKLKLPPEGGHIRSRPYQVNDNHPQGKTHISYGLSMTQSGLIFFLCIFYYYKALSAPLAGERVDLACGTFFDFCWNNFFAILINHGLTGAFFVASFARLSVFLVSFFRHRTGANQERCRLGWENPKRKWPRAGV